MKKLDFHTFLSCIVYVLLGGCASGSGEEHCVSWNSQRLQQLERDWRAMPIGEPGTKAAFERQGANLHEILKTKLSNPELRELAASTDTMPLCEADRSGFANALLEEIVVVAVEYGDRDCLVTLMSRRFPTRIRLLDTEAYIVFSELPDPIGVLRESYHKCHTPETIHGIAVAFRRAFFGCRINYRPKALTEDDEICFVAAALDWYEKNSAAIEVNRRYGENSFTLGQYEHNPLFILRNTATKPATAPETE